jgi:TonB-dependent receptor
MLDIMNFKTLLITFGLFISFQNNAQNVLVQGKITDAKDSSAFYGASITIEGTEFKVRTDSDGNYSISGNLTGLHTVIIKSAEFETQRFENQNFITGSVITLNVALISKVNSIAPVEVKGKTKKTGNAGLVQEQKNSATVVDGTSAEAIKKTPDARTNDVLKRISGASIQDNKFVIIRGLNDRYNAAYINGAPLPSSESDRKAFSFDIFASNMLENLLITKTATPDLPGEFAGGIIQINTKSVVDSNFQSFTFGTSYHSLSTFNNFKTYDGGKYDLLGMNSKSRNLPNGLPTTQEYGVLNSSEKATNAKLMTPGWGLQNRLALPALNLQYSIGKNFKIKNQSLSAIFAYAYQNSSTMTQTTRNEFEEQANGVVQKSTLQDSVYTQSILNTGMLNFMYTINPNNKIAFKNLISLSSDDKVNIRKGVREMDSDPRQWEKSSNRWFTQNMLYSTQLLGNHTIKGTKLQVNWVAGYNNVNRVVPGMRRVVYQKNSLLEDDTTVQYTAVVQNNGTVPTAAGNMFWSTMQEQISSAQVELVMPIEGKNYKSRIKFGAMTQYRDRKFTARNFGFSRYKKTGTPFDNSLLLLPEEEIFTADHLGLMENGLGGFKLEESTKVSDSYSAGSNLNAAFAFYDIKLKEKFRLVGGVRAESYTQKLKYTEAGSNINRTIDSTVLDLLPSLNFIYSPTKKINIRASYYNTVSRPEFRELAPFAFYNFQLDNILSGSTTLKRAKINNFDLRFEYFPGSGQIFTVSTFYKKFTNPIELISRSGVSGAAELYYANVPTAENYGLELEYRVKLNIFNKKTKNLFLNGATVYTNFALIRSKVDTRSINGSEGDSRPLQGQSPYIVNAGLNYDLGTTGWSANASYNIVGARIFSVGNVQEPSVWEKSRSVLDFQIAKKFQNNLEIKFNVRDLLAQDLVFYQDLNKNGKFDKLTDNQWQVTKFGQTVSFSVSYTF